MRKRLSVLVVCLAAVTLAGTTAGHADTIRIVIDKLVFSPADVTATVGDTIEWVNRDALAHTATVEGDWDVPIFKIMAHNASSRSRS